MKKNSHIIWDWNGTIVDDTWLFVELMNEELSIRNLPLINIEKYRQHFTFPVKQYYQNLGFDFNKGTKIIVSKLIIVNTTNTEDQDMLLRRAAANGGPTT